MSSVPALQIQGLRFRWPGATADVLDLESLTIAAGERVFLRGPSGCGKSTLLSLMAGVLLPGAGRVALLGEPWSALSSARRDRRRADHLGYIFQQFNLLPYLSVLDNVRLPARFSRRRADRTRAGDAERLLERSGLAPALWARPASSLSVGQQQRVAAVRALLGGPEVVIADEPTSALDTLLRDGFMALLLGECRAHGTSLVFVSHDERLAAAFDTRLSLPQLNRAAPAQDPAGLAA